MEGKVKLIYKDSLYGSDTHRILHVIKIILEGEASLYTFMWRENVIFSPIHIEKCDFLSEGRENQLLMTEVGHTVSFSVGEEISSFQNKTLQELFVI